MFKNKDLLPHSFFAKNYVPQEKFFGVVCCGYEDFSTREGSQIFRKQNIYTLHFVIEGEGILNYDGKEIPIRAGSYFSLPPNVVFRYYPVKNYPWKYLWISYTGEYAEEYFQKLSQGGVVRTDVKQEDSEVLFGEFFSEFFLKKNMGYYKVISTFFSLLDLLSQQKEEIDKNQFYLNEILTCIQLNYANPDFNVNALCKLVHLSHSYLCRIFAQQGLTAKSYLTSVRMEEGLRLIMDTDKAIKDIAYSVGYADEINFMKAFKKRYGKTPTAFRRKPTKSS